MSRSIVFLFCLAMLSVLLGSCAATGPSVRTASPGDQPPPPDVPKPGDILDTATGSTVSFAVLMDDLAHAQVVYVGETHISSEDHTVQMKVLEALYGRDPSLILAMEMFPRETQPVLNRWSMGLLDEEAFLRESRWSEVWGYPFELYRDLLTFARDKGIRVVALNAPQSVVRKIAREGLPSLGPEDRSRIAREFDFEDPGHRDYIHREYEGHVKDGIQGFESFYEAQLAWEETMAETLAETLRTWNGGRQILVLLGKGHMNYRFGVPQRAEKRVEHTHRTVLPTPVDVLELPVTSDLADYVWVTDKAPSPHPHGPRLGIVLEGLPEGGGLQVIGVMPGSPAEEAGIRKGDIVNTIDGVPVKNVEDIHGALASSREPVHRLRLGRGGEEVEVTVTLPRSIEVDSTP